MGASLSPLFLEQDTPAIKLNPSSCAGTALLLVEAGVGRAEDPWTESSALGWRWEDFWH